MPRAVYDPERDRRIYEESKKKEEAQQAQEQQQFDQATGEEGPKTVNPLEQAGQTVMAPFEGLSDLMENASVSILDALNPEKDREQIEAERAEAREEGQQQAQEIQEQIDADTGFGAEAVRVGMDVVAGSVEDTLNTVDLLGDYAKLGVNKLRGVKTKPTEDPYSDRYTAAAYSFGLTKPKTDAGQFASKIGKVLLIARQVAARGPKFLTGLGTGGKGLKGAIASGLIPGAVADFITTTPEDGNFSAMVNNFIPETSPLHDSFVFALRSEETDDVGTAKLKAALEGGVMGAVADGFLWLMWGRKAAQKAIKEGASKEEALKKGVTEMGTKMKEVDANHTKLIAKEGELWDEANTIELTELLNTEQSLVAKLQAMEQLGLPATDPKLKAAQETLQDVRLHLAEVDGRIARGYDPDDIKGVKPQNTAAYNKPAQLELNLEQQYKAASPVEGMKSMPADPFLKEVTPKTGGSYHMLTDAQYKIQSYNPDAEALIRETSKRADLQQLAESLGAPVTKVVQYAADVLDDFRHALDGEVPNTKLIDMMRENGLLDPKVRDGEKILSKAGVLVTKALIGDTAEQIGALAKEATELRAAGQPIGNQIDRLTDRLVTLLEFHKTTAYETGSKLEIFRRRIGVGTDGLNTTDDLELSIKEVRDWATKVRNLTRKGDPAADAEMQRLVNMMVLSGGDPTKQVKFLYAAITQGAKQATTAMYQSILSGPITHFRNALGNGYSLIERPFSTFVRATIKGDKEVQSSAIAGVHAMTTGIGDAWKIAKQTYTTGTSVNFNTKFAVDDFETQAMLRQMELAATTDAEKIAAGFLSKSYRMQNNPWLSWPSRALMASDDFFKSLSARYRMYSKAKFESLIHAEDGASADYLFDQYIKKFGQGIDPGTGRILDKDLLDYAERATFQQDPGAFMNAIGNAVDALPLGSGRLFLPFIRTPGNLLGYGLEHLPIANQALRRFDTTYQNAVKNGDRLLASELEGRYATGVMAMGSLLTIAMFTDVTGNYPPDPAERAAWKAEGRPPMAIKVGGKWVSYAALEPINSFLSVTADIVRLAKMGGADAAQRAMHQLAYSITAGYTDKSFLAGLSEIGEIFSPKNMNDPSGLRMALNMANNYAPYAGLRRAFANSVDPYMKELRGELDRMLIAAAPGYGGDLPSVTSPITGEKMLAVGGGLFNAVSPIRLYDVNTDYVTNQLTDLGYPSNNIVKTGKYGVKLEPQHREQLAQILAKSGMNAELTKVMKSKEWQAMAKAYRDRPIDVDTFLDPNENQPPHIRMVSKIIAKYKKTALTRLERLDDSYKLLLAEEKYRRQNAERGDFSKPDLETLRQYAGLE